MGKNLKKSNKDIALNISSVPPNEEIINIIHKSNHNRNRKNQVVLLTITDNKQEDTPDK